MHKIIKDVIESKPYKVELAVIDYQDEGISLDVFVWKDIYTLLEVDSLGKGTVDDLQKQMIETHKLLLENGVNSEYTLEVEVC